MLDRVAAEVLSRDPRLGPVRLVCVDGPAGSGKTTFAGLLAERLGAEVVHTDDLLDGWGDLEGMWPRLEEWVLAPLAAGRPGRYRRYDWGIARFAEWHDVPAAPVLVLEGCGSARRAVAPSAALCVWVEADPAVRRARGLDRDGEAVLPHWADWTADEDRHFAAERTRERADVLVDANDWGRMGA
ncbi:AAA family ATPase [Cellulomonas fimi]|uniref:AAA family ATPase n=1 Tax=Cellulomonas fimi TaxID=1708 RepID=A0A7Y0LYR2_CELFI|nr:AAA family ATPase [Cellulomonas fimi]